MKRIAAMLGVSLLLALLPGAHAPATPHPRIAFPTFETATTPEMFFSRPSVYRVHGNVVDVRVGRTFHFHPVATGRFCLAAWNHPSRRHDRIVVDVARAFWARASVGRWVYGFPNHSYGTAAGWISGMAQGLGMGCMVAAYAITGDSQFLTRARLAFAVLVSTYGDAGTRTDPVWFEELAKTEAEPAHILNGHVFALGGAWFANRYDPDPIYERTWSAGVELLKQRIDRYRCGRGCSWYDDPVLGERHRAGYATYNMLHARQLRWMYQRTGHRHFLDIAWELEARPRGR